MNVIELLQKAVVDQASDIFIIAGLPVSYRTNGRILREDGERLMPPQTSEFVQQLYELAQARDLSPLLERGDDDFSFAIPGLSRFRVSAYKQRGALSAVIRVITFELPHPEDIGIPAPVMKFAGLSKGMVLVTGPAGSGKSTIMNIIGALDVPTEGKYILNGQDVSEMEDDSLAEIRNKTIGFVFQQYNLLPKQNLLENVELPLIYAGVGKKERTERSLESLERVGLRDKWRYMPQQLSGGQQQRVSIARALVGNPSLILADEPTGALDSKTGREVLDFLKQLHEEGNTVVIITHDNSIAVEAERVVKISDGKIIFDGDVKAYESIL